MTRQGRVMLGTAWATFAFGTVVSLSLNAGVVGCSSAHNQQAASPDHCQPSYLGATKAAPVLPPGCERPHPAAPSNLGLEQAPQQAQ